MTVGINIGGSIPFPLPAIADSLHEADRLLTTLIPLMSDAINFELGGSTSAVNTGSVWDVARTGTQVASNLPVHTAVWRPPDPAYLREARKFFPLLAIYRTGEAEDDDYSMEIPTANSLVQLDYLLAPLTAEGAHRLQGALPIVARVVRKVMRDGGHPAHQGGKAVLRDFDLVVEIELGRVQYGPAQLGEDGKGMEFWAASMPFETKELLDDDGSLVGVPFMGAYLDLQYAQDSRVLRSDTAVPIPC